MLSLHCVERNKYYYSSGGLFNSNLSVMENNISNDVFDGQLELMDDED